MYRKFIGQAPRTMQISFRDFIWRDRDNRMYLLVGLLGSLILFQLFKLFYLYPNMVMDSYVYIRAMVFNLGANSFPIGYSKFLQVFSLFSRNTTLLVWMQFLMMNAACIWLYFTFLYFFRPGKWVARILLIFLFFNPMLVYISNFIMADTLFTTLSLLWFTVLIWIVGRPRPYMIFMHALLLVLVFTVRYNALYYPMAAAFAIALSRLRFWLKIAAIVLPWLLIGVFILYTSSQMEQLMGVRNFSPFGGWKLGSNALYMYGHVCQERMDPVPPQFVQLDLMVRKYFYKVRRVDDLMDYESFSTGTFYGAHPSSPLIQYMNVKYGRDTIFQNFKKWGPAGAFCGKYGSYLVRKYPMAFVRYFIWPNMVRYMLPPREIFSHETPYHLRADGLGQMASSWFGLKTLEIPQKYIDFRTSLLSPFPIVVALIHLAFILGFIGFTLFNGFKKLPRPNAFIILAVGGLWFIDFVFNVSASPVVLRYQLFMMVLELAFALVFLDFIAKDHKPRAS